MNEIFVVIGHINHNDAQRNVEAKLGREFTSGHRMDHLGLFQNDMRAHILQTAQKLANIPAENRALIVYSQHPWVVEACVDYADWDDGNITSRIEHCAAHILCISAVGEVVALGETGSWTMFQSSARGGYMHLSEVLVVSGFWRTASDDSSSRIITGRTAVLGGSNGSERT